MHLGLIWSSVRVFWRNSLRLSVAVKKLKGLYAWESHTSLYQSEHCINESLDAVSWVFCVLVCISAVTGDIWAYMYVYVCALKGFGWSYPLLESVGIERPSSFRSVSVIVAVGLFACRLCCYRAKQPISLLPTLRTTNDFASPTASLLLRANHMTHVSMKQFYFFALKIPFSKCRFWKGKREYFLDH